LVEIDAIDEDTIELVTNSQLLQIILLKFVKNRQSFTL